MSDLLGMIRRHWWLVALFTVVGIGAAVQYTARQPKVYEASSSVLVQPTGAGQDTNVVGGRTKGDINLDTEAQLVRSTAVATEAATLMRDPTAPDSLAANVTVEVPPNTSVLVITYSAADARTAQAGSHAFAEAYLRNREETANADLSAQIGTVDGKLRQLNAALAQVNARLSILRPDSPERANLESQRATITAQVNTLSARMNQLSTTTVSAGKIIRDAALPKRPSRPILPLNLGSGAAVGLLLGVGAAVARERLDRRIRRVADVVRRCDVPVLAAMPPRVRPRFDDVFPPFGAGGRVFNRLRNEVVAGAGAAEPAVSGGAATEPAPPRPGSRPRAQVIVVAGASRGSSSTVVAANLAAAFARTGGQTVLVCAHLPDSVAELAPVTRLLGVRATPGLSDVLAGRVPLGRAVQRAPRQPKLSVLTTGGTATAGGLLQSQALRDTLGALRRQAEYIVIEAPSTSTSADAQSVASLADAAIIAIELRRTRYADVTDAAEQVRRVGTPVLGAVVLPRLVRHRDEPPPAPVPAEAPDHSVEAGGPDLLDELARMAQDTGTDTVVLNLPPGKRPDVDTAVLALTGIDLNGIPDKNPATGGKNGADGGAARANAANGSEPKRPAATARIAEQARDDERRAPSARPERESSAER